MFNQRHRILRVLMDAMIYRRTVEYPPGSGQKLTYLDEHGIRRDCIGEIPMPLFRSKDCGGDSAQVRLNELRMPQEEAKQYCGIPIHKRVRSYRYNNEDVRVVTYRLGITKPELVELFIDFENLRLRKDVIEQHGGEVIEFLDDADGHDKSGRTVKIVKKSDLVGAVPSTRSASVDNSCLSNTQRGLFAPATVYP